MKFAEFLREDRRLQILLCLEASPSYRAGHFFLRSVLDGYGHESSMDVLKSELAWLEEQGLITTSTLGDSIVCELLIRGLDVAQGRTTHPGIKRPQPL